MKLIIIIDEENDKCPFLKYCVMTASSRPQEGGEAASRGMDYQKKFAAFLCCKMLLEKKIMSHVWALRRYRGGRRF